MNKELYNKLNREFNIKVFNECLDSRDYRCLKKFLEASDVAYGGFGGIIPVPKNKLIDILKEEYIDDPHYWINSMVDFGMLQNHYGIAHRSVNYANESYETFGINPEYRDIINLKYFAEHEIV